MPMAIQSRKNQYVAVNAHLHSVLLQDEAVDAILHRVLQGEVAIWDGFHSAHIMYLAEAIENTLPPGYEVRKEKSLQIKKLDLYDPFCPSGFRRNLSQADSFQVGATTSPRLILSPELKIEWGNCYEAIVIYKIGKSKHDDMAVTRIEILSPFTKTPEMGYGQYREKRTIALTEGILLVEIDYLYQSPPITELIPNYVERELYSYPYSIAVTVPRPLLREGELRIYSFRVDAPMPVIEIPLSGNDVVTVNFGNVYNQTYASSGFSDRVDYELEPVQGYSWGDRARIRARIAAIKAAHAQGIYLEQGPFPIPGEIDELNQSEKTYRGEVFYGRDDTGYI